MFQYKILNNVLFSNKHLFKINKVASPVCSQCNETDETIAHLFCECYKTKQIWQSIQVCLQDIFLRGSQYNVPFGSERPTKYPKQLQILLNHIFNVTFQEFSLPETVNLTNSQLFVFSLLACSSLADSGKNLHKGGTNCVCTLINGIL